MFNIIFSTGNIILSSTDINLIHIFPEFLNSETRLFDKGNTRVDSALIARLCGMVLTRVLLLALVLARFHFLSG